MTHPESWTQDWPDWYIVECRREFSPSVVSVTANIGATYVIGNSYWWGGGEVKEIPKKLGFSFSTEVITGWRAWRIVDFERRGNTSEKRLQALGTYTVWEPYEAGRAICNTDGTHESPWPTCKCGFWAFKDRSSVEKSLFDSYGGEKGKVIGQIALWGRVLECTRGYRGEFAYPQTLQFVEVAAEIAADVAERYGIPHSIVKRTEYLQCEGAVVATEFDYDRLFATIKYSCGIEVRAEISRNFGGKQTLDFNNPPPCPEHN